MQILPFSIVSSSTVEHFKYELLDYSPWEHKMHKFAMTRARGV